MAHEQRDSTAVAVQDDAKATGPFIKCMNKLGGNRLATAGFINPSKPMRALNVMENLNLGGACGKYRPGKSKGQSKAVAIAPFGRHCEFFKKLEPAAEEQGFEFIRL